jgi:hypothetical protein
VAGKAKVKVMDTDNTAEYIVVKEADGTLAVRDLSTIATDGSNPANEIQDLTLVGNTLKITKNGTATEIDLSQYLDDTKLSESEVDGFVVNNGYLTVHIDSVGVAALGYVAGTKTLTEILTESSDAGNIKITNLAAPTASQDAATKG